MPASRSPAKKLASASSCIFASKFTAVLNRAMLE
jgi:hypothetical protein